MPVNVTNENCFASCGNNKIINEWDYNKNIISPFNIHKGSKVKIWWKCIENHSFECSIQSRVYRNRNCDICNSLIGYGDEEILNQWDRDKNGPLTSKFRKSSPIKVWWKCELGHSWICSIHSRTYGRSTKCPKCTGGKQVSEENSLFKLFPELAAEWHLEMNELKTNEVLPGTEKKFWWKCKDGHIWYQSIYQRIRHESKCRECITGYEWRDISSTKVVEGKITCKDCKILLEINSENFHFNKSKKIFSLTVCKLCNNKRKSKNRNKNLAHYTFKRKKYEAARRNLDFDLDEQWIAKKLTEINFCCELTKIPFNLEANGVKASCSYLDSLSVDRIDPSKGYIKTNVRFILNQINTFKSNGSDEQMFALAKALVDNMTIGCK